MDYYIQLYYEPLVEEYEEMKYFVQEGDRKLNEMIGKSEVKAIYYKP